MNDGTMALECLKLACQIPNLTSEETVSRAQAYYDFINNTVQTGANQS